MVTASTIYDKSPQKIPSETPTRQYDFPTAMTFLLAGLLCGYILTQLFSRPRKNGGVSRLIADGDPARLSREPLQRASVEKNTPGRARAEKTQWRDKVFRDETCRLG